jgi:hypothetical protein
LNEVLREVAVPILVRAVGPPRTVVVRNYQEGSCHQRDRKQHSGCSPNEDTLPTHRPLLGGFDASEIRRQRQRHWSLSLRSFVSGTGRSTMGATGGSAFGLVRIVVARLRRSITETTCANSAAVCKSRTIQMKKVASTRHSTMLTSTIALTTRRRCRSGSRPFHIGTGSSCLSCHFHRESKENSAQNWEKCPTSAPDRRATDDLADTSSLDVPPLLIGTNLAMSGSMIVFPSCRVAGGLALRS